MENKFFAPLLGSFGNFRQNLDGYAQATRKVFYLSDAEHEEGASLRVRTAAAPICSCHALANSAIGLRNGFGNLSASP